MIRPVWFFFSLALHAGLVALILFWPGNPPSEPDPDAAVAVIPVPPEAAPAPIPAGNEATAQAEPPPAQEPPPAGSDAAALVGPLLPPDVAVISPVKRNIHLPPPLHLGQGQIKTGKITAMTLRRMAGYDFTLDEFCGHYEVSGEPGRFVDVTRHPADAQALLLRDSATGMVRTLRRFSKFIFTYGPGFYEDLPVEGSVTFLARKDFERIADVDERSRLLWQADRPPARVAVRLDGAVPPPVEPPAPPPAPLQEPAATSPAVPEAAPSEP